VLIGTIVAVVLTFLFVPIVMMLMMMGMGSTMGGMMGSGGMGGMMGQPSAMMGPGWLLLVSWLAVILGAVLVLVWGARQSGREKSPTSEEAPLTILQRRYARGELSPEEYQRIRADLLRDEGAP
jgi:uncharacterized membrane protein